MYNMYLLLLLLDGNATLTARAEDSNPVIPEFFFSAGWIRIQLYTEELLQFFE